ncbi:MAG: HNH endonuclease, partial [Elainellaceae cyanobacterium]
YWGIDRGKGWVFCSSEGHIAHKHRWTRITRHIKVRTTKSPYDGDWLYWASRRGAYPGTSPKLAQLLKLQAGCCAYCELVFAWNCQIEIHHSNGNHQDNNPDNLKALHRHCHDQVHGVAHQSTNCICDKDSPVEEPCEVKVSRTVLQPSGGGDSFA